MRLYKLTVLHAAPKDVHESMEGYVIANTEAQVFMHVDGNQGNKWAASEVEREDDDGHPCSMSEWVMLNGGDMEDDTGFEDAYYGVTKRGWEDMGDLTEEQARTLIELGVAVDIRKDPTS